MQDKHTKGEIHGCIVCGRLYELYVVYSRDGTFIDCTVMSPGGTCVPNRDRPLVACKHHSADAVERAVERAYGKTEREDD